MWKGFCLLFFFVCACAHHNYTDAWDYPNMGLPSDALVTGDLPLQCQLLELSHVGRTLYLKSVTEQSKYADMVMRAHVADEEWLAAQIEDAIISFSLWKECSIGNVAYAVLHASRAEHRSFFAKLLADYITWKKDQAQEWWQVIFSAEFPTEREMQMHPFDFMYCNFMYWKRTLLG